MTTIQTLNDTPDAATLSKVAAALGSAFKDDPFFHYALGARVLPSDIPRRLSRLFLGCLKFLTAHTAADAPVHISADAQCAALWLRFDAVQLGGRDALPALYGLVRAFRWRTLRFFRLCGEVEAVHPSEPHMYLWVLGTAAGAQGRGLGREVMEVALAQCDAEALPAYLESANERNLPFYKRLGFEVTGRVDRLPEDCPPVTCLWRKPRPVAG